MDDSLETPNALPIPSSSTERVDEEDEQSSGDEDGGLDWTRLPTSLSRPVIPKRGEKDFEPSAEGGSGLQVHVLDRARSAMLEALKATRDTSSKNISHGIWCPSIARAHVTLARGIHFAVMGHSVPRDVHVQDGMTKAHKRLELLPEEAIYLVERGAMFCWKENDAVPSNIPGMEGLEGSPMSVQQAFAEMIGKEDLTLEKYQVFAYLRRLGYVVTRAEAPTSAYPRPPPFTTAQSMPSFMQRLSLIFLPWFSKAFRFFAKQFDWWNPLRIRSSLRHHKNYASIYRSLRFMCSGHAVPLWSSSPISITPSPYKIFYNLYKPSTPFRKTAPPPPDFSIVVINARSTSMPTVQELSELFDVLPELPPPLPRQRRPLTSKTSSEQPPPAPPNPKAPPAAETESFKFRKLFSWAFPHLKDLETPARKPNPFMALKAGKKNVVIAVVDAGSISFFRFGQGAFTDWPMI